MICIVMKKVFVATLMCSNVDDLCYFNRSTTSNYTNMYKHDASATEIYAAWTEIYKGVRNANAFMEAIVETEFDKEPLRYSCFLLARKAHYELRCNS